jgi:antitoxin CcdA
MKRALPASKVPTNLSLRAELLKRARALDINLSELLDAALRKEIRAREREAWLAENRDAISGYNARVGKRGVFSDDWRRF